jgi:two-component system cell cycle response regulator DivK
MSDLTRDPRNTAPLILLVDDFEDALDIYRDYLNYRGYRVIVARDGGEAVAMATEHRPDLILLDLRMPVMTGLDAVKLLRLDRGLDGCPIVALTAHALEAERLEALRAGFDEVIAKPCLPDDLATSVARLLGNKVAGPVVLVVTCIDDHARCYSSALSRHEFAVQLAQTGHEALTVAERVRPDCVVVDDRVPDMEAWEVCRRLKEQPQNKKVRIIVLTQQLTAEAATGSVKVGCNAWLMQPTIADDLVEAVRDVLESDTAAPASPADALLGRVACPACAADDVRAGVRLGAVQYYCCQSCRLCWRVETASAA